MIGLVVLEENAMNSHLSVGLAFGLIVILSSPTPANTVSLSSYIEYTRSVQERIFSNYVPVSEDYPHPNGMRANVKVMRDGKISSAKLTFMRKDPDSEFSLLEAIYSSSPLPPVPEYESRGVKFARDQEFTLDLSELKKKSIGQAKPQTPGAGHAVEKLNPKETVGLHLIPLDVLNRYPGLFSRSELMASNNIATLSKDGLIVYPEAYHPAPSKKLMSFFRAWESFFVDHPEKVTREEVLAFKETARTALLSK